MKKRLIRISATFLLIMILFTILSRVMYNMSTAVVETTVPISETMGPNIETRADVEGTQEIAVSTKENLIIKSIYVTVGENVKKDQVLYKLDEKELSKQVKEKKQELELNQAQLESAQNSIQAAEDAQAVQINQAKSDYDRAVIDGDTEIQRAQEELDESKKRYEQYLENPDQFLDLTEEQLKEDVAEKEKAYQDAIKNKDEAVYSAQKAIDSASVVVPSDNSSILQLQMERQKIDEELNELETLDKQKGEIKAPVDGIVTSIDGQVGSRTTGTGEIKLFDAAAGARIVATFQKEYGEFVKRGQTVEIIEGVTGKEEKELTIASVAVQKNEETMEEEIVATVDVPSGFLELGTSVNLKIDAPSEKYDTCIPISALNVGEKGKYYVNIIEKEKTVLGEEWIVHKRDVDLLFKNEKYAAISGVNQDEEIVAKSSRVLNDGMHVKRKIT